MNPSQIQTQAPSYSVASMKWEEPMSSSDETVVHDSDDTSADEAPHTPDEVRCKYPSKFCGRPRARKANGTFHRLCQYHRNKANTNQKRWTSVRRKQAKLKAQQRRVQEMLALDYEGRPSFSAVDNGQWIPTMLPDPVRHEPRTAPAELPWEDLHILYALLVNDLPTHDTTYMYPQKPVSRPFEPTTYNYHSPASEWYVHC